MSMVSLSITGTVAIKPPPYIKIQLKELEELHEKACKYDELATEVHILLMNDSIKDSIIVSYKNKVELLKEEKFSLKESNDQKDNKLRKIKKGTIFRDIIIGVLTVVVIVVSVK